jgi:hypothetical protein
MPTSLNICVILTISKRQSAIIIKLHRYFRIFHQIIQMHGLYIYRMDYLFMNVNNIVKQLSRLSIVCKLQVRDIVQAI